MYWEFMLQSMLLGAGLAMDAFSVSVANGLSEAHMKKSKLFATAGTFAFFQCLMPLIGWLCVRKVAQTFTAFKSFIPYIALVLLLYIGGKMIVEYRKGKKEDRSENKSIGVKELLIQGVATSIDALSVGFTIEGYAFSQALACASIIAAITFVLCCIGLVLGKRFSAAFAKAELIGGMILIFIGLEIFIKGVFFTA
ncbi:MAG: manganese efflux pump [Clostridia bacterium]|nr:manganese efflux pump [Clostridia bacterium]